MYDMILIVYYQGDDLLSDKTVIFCGNDEQYLSQELIKDSNSSNEGTAFRIPAVINAGGGTLIAAAVMQTKGDNWGYLELATRISEDFGETWSNIRTIFSPPARETSANAESYASAFFLNPCMALAPNGDIILLAEFFPECRDLHNRRITDKKKAPYSMFERKMCPALYDRDGKFYLIREDGVVLNNKLKETIYKVTDRKGSLYYGEKYAGNIFLNGKSGNDDGDNITFGAPLKAPKRNYIYMFKSSDKGRTWSNPVDITPQILTKEDGCIISISSGNGLTTQDGRIIMPLYIDGKENISIYSVDDGDTWHRMTQQPYANNTDEWQAVQSPDGIIFGIGSQKKFGRSPLSISFDKGKHWDKATPTEIYSPKCQKSVISIGEYVFCSHPSEANREKGVITIGKFKQIKGKSIAIDWHTDIEINKGFFGYSCLTQIDDENIGIIYESAPSSYICFQKFKIKDIV